MADGPSLIPYFARYYTISRDKPDSLTAWFTVYMEHLTSSHSRIIIPHPPLWNSFLPCRWVGAREGEVQGDLWRAWPDVCRNVRLLSSSPGILARSSLAFIIYDYYNNNNNLQPSPASMSLGKARARIFRERRGRVLRSPHLPRWNSSCPFHCLSTYHMSTYLPNFCLIFPVWWNAYVAFLCVRCSPHFPPYCKDFFPKYNPSPHLHLH